MTRIAIGTPVVTMTAGLAPAWEKDAGIKEVARIAETADRLGYHHMTCSEHIGIPAHQTARRGARYYDPLATFGYLAAVTSQIRFVTLVLVLGYHHPLEIAKRYGTLDKISDGRLILGLGVGTLKEEFDLLGAPFDDRGVRADDAMRALRASLSQSDPSYHGEFYDFEGLTVDPCAVQDKVPLWVGGQSLKSLKRAASLGDGWSPFNVKPEQVTEWLGQVERADDFEVVLGPGRVLDPINDPGAAQEALGKTEELGATIVSAYVAHTSLEHYLEQLEALAEADAAK